MINDTDKNTFDMAAVTWGKKTAGALHDHFFNVKQICTNIRTSFHIIISHTDTCTLIEWFL